MTSAQLRVPLLTVRLYSSEQLKENQRPYFGPAHYEQCNFLREMQNQARTLPEQQENLWFIKDGPYELELICEPLEIKPPNFPTVLIFSALNSHLTSLAKQSKLKSCTYFIATGNSTEQNLKIF